MEAARTIVFLTTWPLPGRRVTLWRVTSASSSRLAWVDWMRGLACVLMFQTHCYDSWLGGAARNGSFLHWSQRLGTLPAPLFLFLAGVSFALVIGKLLRKGLTPGELTRAKARRGAEIFVFGLLFRLQEYTLAWGWAPWTDLFRVDVLNIIGLSMILMALVVGLVLHVSVSPSNGQSARMLQTRQASTLRVVSGTNAHPATHPGTSSAVMITPVAVLVTGALATVVLIALLTPPLYTTWRPTWLPWELESYINGCHNLGKPQPWLFPLFPWAGFAFAGLGAGFILFSDWARNRLASVLALFAAVGAAAIVIAYVFDHSAVQLYSTYDYWHTSPNFFMMRVGMLLMIAFLAYAWCRGLALLASWATRVSPLIQLGQTSLLVYWVHIEFVYGRFSLLPKRAVGIAAASRGLLEICLFMLILSLLRTRVNWKSLGASLRARLTPEPKPAD